MQRIGLLAEEAVELDHDGGRLGQPMRILCGRSESDEGSRTVRRSGGRDIPVMRMSFQTQAHVIPFGTHHPDRRSKYRADLREMAQKGVSGTQEGPLISDPFREPPTPLGSHAQHGACSPLSLSGLVIRLLFSAL